ncbi:MAG TPA: FKBP-type peptidyl-prolyl cis-trans isomerase [Bacteroidia bacterium]
MGVADILFKRRKELAEKNLKEGQEFMAENAKKDGVVTLESGLQYEVLVMGEGEKPTAKNTVTCHYHGTTIHGEVFDSSVNRGQPASFPLNRVITGWTEGVQLMPVGSKFKFTIPPHLAYGEEQISKEIGPNSTLIFEVELLGIK